MDFQEKEKIVMEQIVPKIWVMPTSKNLKKILVKPLFFKWIPGTQISDFGY